MATMTGLEFEIRGNTNRAIQSLEKLRSSIEGVKVAARGNMGLSGAARGLKKFTNTLGKVDAKKFAALGQATTSITRLGRALAGFSDNQDAFENVCESLTRLSQIDFSNLSQAAADLERITYAMTHAQGTKQNTFKDLFKTDRMTGATSNPFAYMVDSVRIGFIGVLKVIGDVARKIGNIFLRLVKFIISIPGKIRDAFAKVGHSIKEWYGKSIFTKPLRDFSNGIQEIISKVNALGRALKRVVFYRIIRSLIKDAGQALKTGINNLYEWSQTVGGDFARSMDTIATSMAYFKNSIGAAVSPLINALAPAIDFVIDKIVTLLNVINQFLARITGASYWTRAIKNAQSYGDAVSGAGSAAKEAAKYLAPFDELNVLPSDSGGGGGSGGGSSGGGLFEEISEFDSGIAAFADKLREAFLSGNWQELGTTIGEKINEVFANIKWDELGAKVGYYINGLFTTEYWTLKTTDFEAIGSDIAKFLNNAIENIDFSTVGATLVLKLTSIGDLIYGFFHDLKWEDVGGAIHDFLVGYAEEWASWFDGKDWQEVKTTITTNLKNFFSGLNFSDIVSAFSGLGSSIWNAIKSGFPNATSWAETNIINPISSAIRGETSWLEAGRSIIDSIKKGFPTWKKWVMENIIDPIGTAICGEENWSNAKQFIANLPNTMKNWVSTSGDKIKEVGKLIGNGIVEGIKEAISISNISQWVFEEIFGEDGANWLREHPGWSRILFGSDSPYLEVDVTANLTDTKDNIPSAKKLIDNMSASIKSRALATGFDSTIYGMTSQFRYRNFASAYDDTVRQMTSQFRYRTFASGYDSTIYNMTAKITKLELGASVNLKKTALGGAYFGGRWHDIPQYASGTLNAGSIFVAGEAGPEIVGHINGRTEVLNASQIASAIAAGVSMYSAPGNNEDTEELLYRAFIRALSETGSGGDIYLDGEKIYQSVVTHNTRNTRMTGVNAFA